MNMVTFQCTCMCCYNNYNMIHVCSSFLPCACIIIILTLKTFNALAMSLASGLIKNSILLVVGFSFAGLATTAVFWVTKFN